jgi:hypothetical protein
LRGVTGGFHEFLRSKKCALKKEGLFKEINIPHNIHMNEPAAWSSPLPSMPELIELPEIPKKPDDLTGISASIPCAFSIEDGDGGEDI